MDHENDLPFHFEMPMSVFEKAGAPAGQRRRIGGIASIETKDRQDEVVLARGLDFSDFRDNGWFNDNHSKATDGVVGYPEETRMFKAGERLPDGQVAPAPGHWVEGYLLEGHPPADRIWGLAQSLQKTKRRLGFSVEGRVVKRGGIHKSGGKLIAKAKVRNVAVTNCPVNTVAKMDILIKSLQVADASEATDIEKALGMGDVPAGNAAPVGPQTGMGAGQVITGQSLEKKKKPPRVVEAGSTNEDEDDKKDAKKSMPYESAIHWVMGRLPNATRTQARRVVDLTLKRKANHGSERRTP